MAETPKSIISIENAAKQLSSSFNTKDIMILLCKASHNISKNIPNTNRGLKQLVIIDHTTANLNKNLQESQSNLTEMTDTIKFNINQLGKNPRNQMALQLQQYYLQRFPSLDAETQERINQRQLLTKSVEKFVGSEYEQISHIAKTMAENPNVDVSQQILELLKKIKNLSSQIEKLIINEKALESKLKPLKEETTLSITSISPGAIPTPKNI